MRIDGLAINNFKGFDSKKFFFHPQFNLIVGKNGTGKTSILDALSVAIGCWNDGSGDEPIRNIQVSDVLLKKNIFIENDTDKHLDINLHWESQFPCAVAASGIIQETKIEWCRLLSSSNEKQQILEPLQIFDLARSAFARARKGLDTLLPLIAYYGTGRLGQEPRAAYAVTDPTQIASKEELSRIAGYANSLDPHLSVRQLMLWIARQSWITFQRQGREPPAFRVVKEALTACIEDAEEIQFDATLGEVVVTIAGTVQPFSNLSDGQRSMLAMVGDIAQRAATLNPHLGSRVLQETYGVVLIDELDLHLHPRWQRRIIADLKRF
ncbi:MAG: AAA family ATPase [Magnetococcus sp. YQC-9]